MRDTPEIRFKGFTGAWVQRKLGEVAELSSSKRIHVSDYVSEGIPFYRGSEISAGGISQDNELYISEDLYSEIKEKYGIPAKGDLLITAVGTLGNLWKVDNRRFYYKDGNLIRISGLKLDEDYILAYFTDGQGKKKVLDSAAGSSQKALTMIKLNEIDLFTPELSEQTAIGNFFRTLDKTITLLKRKADGLKQLKKAYLQQMFPQAGERVPKVRFAGFSGDWEERRLGEAANIVRGASPRPIQDPKWFDDNSDIGWLRIADVTEQNGRIYSLDQKISKAGQLKTRVLTKPHLLLSIAATIGKPVINYVKTGIHDGFLIFLDPEFEQEFMFQWLEMFRLQWQQYGQPGSQVNLNSDLVKAQKIHLPPNEEQTAIGNFFHNLDEQITAQQIKLDNLKQLKSAYLQRMFV